MAIWLTLHPGYARNFLLPFGKAVPVTPAVMKQVEHRRAKEAERQATLKQEAVASAPPSTPSGASP